MNPLTRQDTRPSIHSWWSDSNPGLRGPTINLHTAAKPLMKLMYHRQTLEFIRKNRGSPLSRDTLETYSSYFPWDYVSRGTKIAILSELTNRTASEVEAHAVVDSPVLNHIAQMLWSPDIETQRASCALLGNLASHDFTAPAILDLCEQLVSLVGEEDSELTQAAQGALCHIAQGDGVQAIVASPVLDHVFELLESPGWAVRGRACDLVEKLAHHDSTLPAILKSRACVLLVPLLRDEHPEVVQSARNASSRIASTLEYASVVDAKMLDHILALLESSNPEVRGWACDQMGRLARRESTLPAMLESEACLRVGSLLSNADPSVFHSAWNALFCIAQMLDNTPAIASKALDRVLDLLKSSNPEVRRWACDRVGGLAHHESILPAVLESKAFARLLSLLHAKRHEVVQSATKALSRIAKKLEGAQAIAESKVLDDIFALLESSCSEVRQQACILIKALIHHESILLAVLESKAFALSSLLHNEHSEVVQSIIKALSQIAKKLAGAQAIVKAKVLDNVSELIESSDWSVQCWACALVEALVHHESILPAVLESKAFAQLLSLLHNKHHEVVQSATKASFWIAKKLEGAQAIVKAKVLDNVSELIESSRSGVRHWACTLIEVLVHHESILPAVLETKICARLVSFLFREAATSTDPFFALCALCEISKWPVGAVALVDMPAIFGRLERLCQSLVYGIHLMARQVLDNLALARSKQQIP